MVTDPVQPTEEAVEAEVAAIAVYDIAAANRALDGGWSVAGATVRGLLNEIDRLHNVESTVRREVAAEIRSDDALKAAAEAIAATQYNANPAWFVGQARAVLDAVATRIEGPSGEDDTMPCGCAAGMCYCGDRTGLT